MLAVSAAAGGSPDGVLRDAYKTYSALALYYLSSGAAFALDVKIISEARGATLLREGAVRAVLFLSGSVAVMNFWCPAAFSLHNFKIAQIAALSSASLSFAAAASSLYHKPSAIAASVSAAASLYVSYVSFACDYIA